MRLFRSEEDLRRFAEVQGEPVGECVPLKQLAALGRRWYADRLAPDWRPRSLEASQALLDATGFTGDFFALKPAAQ
jgi:hypothetical protein